MPYDAAMNVVICVSRALVLAAFSSNDAEVDDLVKELRERTEGRYAFATGSN